LPAGNPDAVTAQTGTEKKKKVFDDSTGCELFSASYSEYFTTHWRTLSAYRQLDVTAPKADADCIYTNPHKSMG
jgi:hypothetical protein